jgi:predicted transcriptional regulator
MTDPVTAGVPGALSAAGVADFDERVYRALLDRPDGGPADLAGPLGATPERVERALDRLRHQGLVNRLAGTPLRYTVVEPDVAVGALVQARARELDRVRAAVADLSVLFHAARREHGRGGAVELVTGPEALGQWFVRLQQHARHELLALDRPPYALAAANPIEPMSLARGVAWRGIYAPEALEVPGALAEVRGHVARGEQARVLPGLALKLAVADRRIALLPLSLDMDNLHSAVVHESTLLDGLLDLFEAYWARAIPLDATAAEPAPDGTGPALPAEDRELLLLLVTGLKDDAIARQLGLSTRTLRRRMQRLLDALGVTNRFQAGVQAARRGWI